MNSLTRWFRTLIPPSLILALASALSGPGAVNAAESGQTFATPEEAISALATAAAAGDSSVLSDLFGPAAAELVNPDRVQAANELQAFTAALRHSQRLVRESDSRCVLEVGDDSWPFPIPLVQQAGRWCFDTEAGKDELLNRRIGQNELATLRSVRAFVDAQREYAAKDRDGDEVLEFAQSVLSAAGTKSGLYWSPRLDGEISPLGPLVALAQSQGYEVASRELGAAPAPFHGYLFKVLTRQAKSAPGGKYSYVINGNMIGGFALVAWPAGHGDTGIMTFIVNQQGRVYQKDLGPNTDRVVSRLKAYAPDATWAVSPD